MNDEKALKDDFCLYYGRLIDYLDPYKNSDLKMKKITIISMREITCMCIYMFCLCLPFSGNPQVVPYPVPLNEQKYDAYQLQINEVPVDIYACRVSKFPINQWWPGYQRPIEQTESAGFAYWDMKGSVKIEITTKKPVKQVVIRPLSLGIQADINAGKISFKLDSIIPLVVEMDGYHHALHLFPNRIQDEIMVAKSNIYEHVDAYTQSHNGTPKSNICCPQCNYCSPQLTNFPDNKNSQLYYFGPGLHDIGTLQLKSNDSVYIAGGAVVYGSFIADNADNITIWGRGILDGGHIQRADMRARAGFGCIHFRNSSNITIRGIILRDPNSWGCNIRGCQNVDISNLKFIGFWRYNSDGIDIWNSRDVSLKDCFIRAYDDAVVIRATGSNNKRIHISHCVLWNDWGQSFVISARDNVREIEDITFKNMNIIRASSCAMRIGNYTGANIRDVEYENVNVEIDDWVPRPKMQESKEELYIPDQKDRYCPGLFCVYITAPSGTIDHITYRNIQVIGNTNALSSFKGFDSEHTTGNVLIKNLQFNNRVISDFKEAKIKVGEFVHQISIEE